MICGAPSNSQQELCEEKAAWLKCQDHGICSSLCLQHHPLALLVLTSWSKAEKFSALDQEVRTSKRMMLQMLDGMGLDWEVIWIWLVVVLSTDVLGYSLLI